MRSKSKLYGKDPLWGHTFISPMLIGFIVISLLPIIATFFISLTDWALLNNKVEFIGFENYKKLFSDPLFYKVTKNTILFTVLLIPSNLVLCLGLASLLKRNFKVWDFSGQRFSHPS